jgi:septal ring factor EnvC (AmiA/AmiB activator)
MPYLNQYRTVPTLFIAVVPRRLAIPKDYLSTLLSRVRMAKRKAATAAAEKAEAQPAKRGKAKKAAKVEAEDVPSASAASPAGGFVIEACKS